MSVTPQKRKKGYIRFQNLLSICLMVILIAGQLPVSNTVFAAATPSPAASAFPTAAGWENWNYFNYAEALQKSIYFYDAEKCGPGITGGRLEWRGDCHVGDTAIPLNKTSLSAAFIEKYKNIIDPDGDGTVDLHGGFHDAGDHVRFGLPQSYAASTLGWSFYEFRDSFKQSGQEEHMIEILKQFTDTFLRCSFLDGQGNMIAFCYMVGEGDEDHTYWGPPELYPDTISRPGDFATAETPGSDVCASTSAALALSYLNFKDEDPQYAAKCLNVAKAMYEFAIKYRGIAKGDGYYNSAYDEDELSWAAVWLYVCTQNMDYIKQIDSVSSDGTYTGYMAKIIKTTTNTWQNIWAHSWDVVWGGVFMKLATLFPDNEQFEYFARWNVEYMTGGKIPHKDPTDMTYIATSPAGYTMINGWGSARYNTAVELCALVYEKYHPNRTDFGDWAKSQMNYLMGRNPMGYSYIVGYGYEQGLPSAKHPHHRAAHGSKTLSMLDPPEHRHILWGALVGGPDLNDFHKDETTDYVYNEVAVDYNAAFVGACAGLYKFYGSGQQPIANFPPKEAEFDPYYCEVRLEQENKERTQVTLKLHNESSQPPHFETGMKCRFFFNISEMLECGQSIDDIELFVAYDEQISLKEEGVKVTGPVKWDNSGTYYYEFDWSGSKIYGDREYQFALVEKQDPSYQTYWNPSNDWSRQGVTKEYAVSEHVPVFLDGVKVFGEEPPKLDPTPTPTSDPNATPVNNASLKVSYKCGDGDANVNTIRAAVNVENTGTTPINLSDIKLRYWYTSDNDDQQSFVCEYAQFGEAKVLGTINKIGTPVATADTYLEIGFASDAGVLAPGSSTGSMPFRIERLSPCVQSNDYSFDPTMTSALGNNEKITAYVKGALKYGVEPVAITPTAPPGYKISGYVLPGFLTSAGGGASELRRGFKVELLGKGLSSTTNQDGYFEISGVPSDSTGYTLRISKVNYLYRDIKNVVVNGNVQIGSQSTPVNIWAGDILVDDAINMSDIVEITKSFNSSAGDSKFIEASDINKDGAINLNDAMIIAANFNKTPANYPAI